MADSLLLAGAFELAGAENPRTQTYTLGGGYTFGDPTPIIAFITSLVLDGDRQTGRRSGNRQHTLPILVQSNTRAGLTVAMDALLSAVDEDTFPLQWTPNGGLPLEWVCSRAVPSVAWSQLSEAAFAQVVTLTFSAQPFGRSTDVETIPVLASSVQLDSFNTAPTGAALDTVVKYEGTGSAKVTLTSIAGPLVGQHHYTGGPVSRTFGSAQDLSAMNAIWLRWRWVTTVSSITMYASLVLHSAAGDSPAIVTTGNFKNGASSWTVISFPLTGSLGSLNPAAVTGYTLTLSSTSASGTQTTTFNIDDMRALPIASAYAALGNNTVVRLPAVKGSARTPISLAFTRSGGGTLGSLLVHRPPNDGGDPAGTYICLNGGSPATTPVGISIGGNNWKGTYDVYAAIAASSGGVVTNTITLTITQRQNGVDIASTTVVLTRTYDNSTATNVDYVHLGTITLPLLDAPIDNEDVGWSLSFNRTAGSDTYTDLIFLDTRGATLITAMPNGAKNVIYLDEPVPPAGIGQVYAAATDRSDAYSILGGCRAPGGPMVFDPGDNFLYTHSVSGSVAVTGSYYPRWRAERADVT